MPKPLESGRTVMEETMARLRAFDLMATPFGEKTAFDFYEKYAEDGGDDVPPRFAYLLDIDTYGGYVFLGVQDDAPTMTYSGDNSACPREVIEMSLMLDGSRDEDAVVTVKGVRGVLHALQQRFAPEIGVVKPGTPRLRAIDGGKAG